MQKLAELCVRRPVLASVLILILVVVGGAGFFRLGVDRFPQVDLPTVSIRASLPGAAPETVETEVTDKIEEAVNTIAGVDELRSSSSEGSSSVTVTFSLDTDIDVATQDVRDRVALIQGRLPDNVDPPTVRRFDPNQIPIMAIAVSGTGSTGDLTNYADKTLRRQVENAGGVGEVQLRGERPRQINIHTDAYRMRAADVTVPDLISALQEQNVEIPGGRMEQADQTLTLRTRGRLRSVQDFNRILLRAGGGHQVRLSDVARVEDGFADEVTSSEFNGRPTVQLAIYKQSGTNTLEVIENVRKRIETLRATVPSGIEINVARSQDDFIKAAVHSVEEHLILGSILASLVVFVFLWNWRSTIISAIAIPTSLIATFGLMWVMGMTLNVITLLALTLAVGIVIDDAIVVLENIYRFMEEKNLSPLQAAVEGTREIGFAVLATTLSLVAVFLPVAFMSGIVGRFLASFGLTMSFAILVSLLVSFTLTPMMTARWRARQKPGDDKKNSPHGHAASSRQRGFYSVIDSTYTGMLKWSMGHRWAVALVCAGVLASIPTLWGMLPYNFLPEEDESQFQVSLEAPVGTSLNNTRQMARKIDQHIRSKMREQVEYTLLTVGGSGFGPGAFNEANIYVRLKPVEKRKEAQADIIQKLRGQLRRLGQQVGLTEARAAPINSFGIIGGRGGGSRIQYVLSGPDLNVLREAADRAVAQMVEIPGVADADTSLQLGQPEVNVDIDRDLAGELGVRPAVLANTLRYLVGGQHVTDYIEGGEQYEVHIRSTSQFRTDETGIGLLTVPASPTGTEQNPPEGRTPSTASTSGSVPLDQLVRFSRTSGPSSIERYNRRRQITLTANVEPGASEATIGGEVERITRELKLGPEYLVTAAGTSREQQRTNAAFILALAMSFVFMYLILAAQFESWLHPVTILLSLPLTVPFALFSLWFFGQSLNIFSLLGILVLFGVVKKNAILQIDHTNQLRARGMNRYDAIITANRDRLRPILMTTLAFVAGMLPLVISSGAGAGTNRAIGTVIFGGQTLSLLLTLLAVPVAYSLFDDLASLGARARRRFGYHEESLEEPLGAVHGK
ncbi:MAG TPA: efflux RND transporter permease subunit [Abditibacteriaceae bacterium]|nr:efflux RND transporter permease subunit [Abditibacteriaceae bacterium]